MGLFDSLFNFGSNALNAVQQYSYQRKLNQQMYDLTQQGFRESPLNQRKGLESAGYNPILAVHNGVNFSNATSGGSVGLPSNPSSGIDESITNAYRTFKLDKSLNEANVNNIKKQDELLEAQTEKAKEETRLMKYDKPLKVVGDLIDKMTPSGSSNGKGISKNVRSVIAPTLNNARQILKSRLSQFSWNLYDWHRDNYSYLFDKLKGHDIPRKYYDGLSKSIRVNRGVYNFKDLPRMKGSFR